MSELAYICVPDIFVKIDLGAAICLLLYKLKDLKFYF